MDSPYNFAVHPDVDGMITINLKDVTLTEALDVVGDIYGYDVRRNNRMIQVFPAGLRSETISLDYLALRRMGYRKPASARAGLKTATVTPVAALGVTVMAVISTITCWVIRVELRTKPAQT